ncbi:MAG: aromatic ring-hydroxylating dioxygenase subunit alpha [Pseudomonadota bacterium]
MNAIFEAPKQLLPKETYYDEAWFERERRELFDQSWVFACPETALLNPGDYHCFKFMDHPLLVVRDKAGEIQAFHNICRHRGCEVLEGSGNTGGSITCPYHRWNYQLDGSLRGVTNERECFGRVEREGLGLLPAAVGTYHGMIFVNPNPSPRDSFESWIANMDEHVWPHNFSDDSMEYAGELTYEMQCNWKIFYENAIDGYHLGYLHDQTLGKLYPDRNVWAPVGRNVVWYSTERDGFPQAISELSEQYADMSGAKRIPGHEKPNYPGVVMLFPLTILSPNPWGMYISILEPVSPEVTNMRTMSWVPKGSTGRFNFGMADSKMPAPIRLSEQDVHPLESGNFQLEDMWICEKIQRNLRSPNFAVGPLADGSGAEAPLMHFQQSVLEYLSDE